MLIALKSSYDALVGVGWIYTKICKVSLSACRWFISVYLEVDMVLHGDIHVEVIRVINVLDNETPPRIPNLRQALNVSVQPILQNANLGNICGGVDLDYNQVPLVGASMYICNGFGGQQCVGIRYLLICTTRKPQLHNWEVIKAVIWFFQ
jgi:hypothetical protein